MLEENAQVLRAKCRAAQLSSGDRSRALARRQGHHHAGLQGGIQAFAEAGWQGVQHPSRVRRPGLAEAGGDARASRCCNRANLSFALCPLLTDGAIEALLTAGTDEQKQTYLPNLISGKWTGTMNLTEPQAGSDLALVRTRAVPQGDGTYKVFGTKIFITYGEHDMAENIVHLVLARTPDAPEGVKGISLFVVPKFLVNADGSLGERNDVHCVSIEHKLGIKASPTAVLQFGDHGGAIGTLVGEENRGLEYMFIMMNAARFAVGMQGIGVAEARLPEGGGVRARTACKSRDLAGSAGPVAIIHHPDVRRMLMSMRAQTEGGARAGLRGGGGTTTSRTIMPDAAARKRNQAFYEYPGADRQGLVDRDVDRRRVDRRAGAWRHGLHRGNRRRAVLPRCAHPDDLRRHDRDPGERPGRPQDRARRRRGSERHPRPGAQDRSAIWRSMPRASCSCIRSRLAAGSQGAGRSRRLCRRQHEVRYQGACSRAACCI